MEKVLFELGLDEHEINIFLNTLRNIKTSRSFKNKVSNVAKESGNNSLEWGVSILCNQVNESIPDLQRKVEENIHNLEDTDVNWMAGYGSRYMQELFVATLPKEIINDTVIEDIEQWIQKKEK